MAKTKACRAGAKLAAAAGKRHTRKSGRAPRRGRKCASRRRRRSSTKRRKSHRIGGGPTDPELNGIDKISNIGIITMGFQEVLTSKKYLEKPAEKSEATDFTDCILAYLTTPDVSKLKEIYEKLMNSVWYFNNIISINEGKFTQSMKDDLLKKHGELEVAINSAKTDDTLKEFKAGTDNVHSLETRMNTLKQTISAIKPSPSYFTQLMNMISPSKQTEPVISDKSETNTPTAETTPPPTAES